MFLTLDQNQIPALSRSNVRAWPTVELEFEEPVFLCTCWHMFPAGVVRKTAFVLLENDLRDLTSSDQECLMERVHVNVPTGSGWTTRVIDRIYDEFSEELQSRVLVFEDNNGELSTLWLHATVPPIESSPIWAADAVDAMIKSHTAEFLQHRSKGPDQKAKR